MSGARLEVGRPCDAWHGAAREGRLVADAEARPVLLLLGPEGASAEALARARLAAAPALALRDPSVLALLDVVAVGDRVAWVFEHSPGLGLGHLVGEGAELLPPRAAAELVAQVGEDLLGLGRLGQRNRGPSPHDLLLEASGRVRLAGFAGPFPQLPMMRAPRGEEGEAAVVYRLGVLLAWLVSGVAPPPASERSAQGALIRRALIRAMARPGPVLSERFGDWLRGMLGWEPSERPPLSAVPEGLRKVAEVCGSEGLQAWAEGHVEPLREQAGRRGDAHRRGDDDTSEQLATEEVPRSVTSSPASPASPAPSPVEVDTDDHRLPSLAETFDDDDTQEASQLPPEVLANLSARVRPPRPRASMPIRVGPPPEAIREPPRLPSGFLDEQEELSEVAARSWAWLWAAVWLAAVMVLSVMVLALLWVLLTEPRSPFTRGPEGPGVADVFRGSTPAASAAAGEPAPGAVPVLFRAAQAGTPLQVVCGDARARGQGEVYLETGHESCLVTGEIDGQTLRANVPVHEGGVLVCFEGGEPRCR